MEDSEQLLEATRYSGLHQGQTYEVRLVQRAPGLCMVFIGPVPAALPTATMSAIQKALQSQPGSRGYADLSACTYLGSGAIACLMEFLRLVSSRVPGAVPLVNPHPRAMTVLRMLGLSNFFVTQPDDAAVAKWFSEQQR